MKRFLCSTAIAGGLVFGVVSAANAVSYTESFYDSITNPNAPLYGVVAPTSSTPLFTLSVTGSIGGVERSPYETNTDSNQGAAYSVLAPGGQPSAATATYNLQDGATAFNILWGSPDTYNHIQFWSGANGSGSLLDTVSGDNLACYPNNCNRLAWDLVSFSFEGVGSIVLIDDGTAAFEYGLANNGRPAFFPTPLPAALWLFGTVVAGAAGASGLRRRRKAAA